MPRMNKTKRNELLEAMHHYALFCRVKDKDGNAPHPLYTKAYEKLCAAGVKTATPPCIVAKWIEEKSYLLIAVSTSNVIGEVVELVA